MAHRLGDPAALALALHGRYLALGDPMHPAARLSVATELARLAGEIGARELQVQAHAWRLGDLLELGEFDGAGCELGACARLADELRQPAHQGWTPMFRATPAVVQAASPRASAWRGSLPI